MGGGNDSGYPNMCRTWMARSHQQLYDDIHTGPGVEGTMTMQDTYARIGSLFAAVDGQIQAGLARIGVAYEGEGSDAAQSGITVLQQWTLDAQTGSQLASGIVAAQADSYTGARDTMPEPVQVTAQDGFFDKVYDFFGGTTAREEQEEQAREAHIRAAQVMSTYDMQSASAVNAMPTFVPPPSVTVEVPPPQQQTSSIESTNGSVSQTGGTVGSGGTATGTIGPVQQASTVSAGSPSGPGEVTIPPPSGGTPAPTPGAGAVAPPVGPPTLPGPTSPSPAPAGTGGQPGLPPLLGGGSGGSYPRPPAGGGGSTVPRLPGTGTPLPPGTAPGTGYPRPGTPGYPGGTGTGTGGYRPPGTGTGAGIPPGGGYRPGAGGSGDYEHTRRPGLNTGGFGPSGFDPDGPGGRGAAGRAGYGVGGLGGADPDGFGPRGGTGASGGRGAFGPGGAGFMQPAAPGSGTEDDKEHRRKYVVETDEYFADDRLVPPPVIGEPRQR